MYPARRNTEFFDNILHKTTVELDSNNNVVIEENSVINQSSDTETEILLSPSNSNEDAWDFMGRRRKSSNVSIKDKIDTYMNRCGHLKLNIEI